MPTRNLRSRTGPTASPANSNADSSRQGSATNVSTRSRRGVAANNPYDAHEFSSATVERSTSSKEDNGLSIRMTVKTAPSKLREVTSGSSGRRSVAVNSRDTFVGGEILSGPRGSRNKKVIVEESSEEEEEEDEDMGEEDDEEDDEDDDDAEDEEDDDVDAEGEEDEEMEDAPPPPPVKTRGVARAVKPHIRVAAPAATPKDRVEAKEMAMADDDDDDEELSELESQEEDDEGEDLGDEDAEGEDDSDSGTPDSMSRDQTPDLSKLTRRQRAAFEEIDGGLMALSNEAQKKKHLTAEEHAMRRAEMARRRKNLSEKRNEEEKMDTINRLLKKQAPKRRGKAQAEIAAENGMIDELEYERPSALYVRYIQNAEGTQLGVPEEWLEAPVGDIIGGKSEKQPQVRDGFNGKMVMEVEAL